MACLHKASIAYTAMQVGADMPWHVPTNVKGSQFYNTLLQKFNQDSVC